MASPIENLPVFPVQESEDINKLPVFPVDDTNQDGDSFFDSAVDFAGETYGTAKDIGTGIGAGLIGLPQGIVETVTSGFDYILDTNLKFYL